MAARSSSFSSAPSADPNPDLFTMSFGDHLDELRKRLILALLAPLPIMIVAFYFSDDLIDLLRRPLTNALLANNLSPTMQVLSPAEAILTQLKLSIIAGLVIAAPWILYQAWKFIAPGLYHHERRFVYFLIPGSAVLTVAGICLLYFAMLPLMLYVLINFGSALGGDIEPRLDPQVAAILQSTDSIPLRYGPPDPLEPGAVWFDASRAELWVALADDAGVVTAQRVPRTTHEGLVQQFRLGEYISFVLMLFVAIVVAFQMPLVVWLIGVVGLADAAWFAAQRKYAVMGCAVASAIITPSDLPSMVAMFLPLYCLYELGIVLLRVFPADRIAEGGLLARRFGPSDAASPPDKAGISADHPDQAAQVDGGAPARRPLDQYHADGDEE